MKKGDVGMAKHFSKKYGNKGWAFDYPVSAIWNQFLFCQDACQCLINVADTVGLFCAEIKTPSFAKVGEKLSWMEGDIIISPTVSLRIHVEFIKIPLLSNAKASCSLQQKGQA